MVQEDYISIYNMSRTDTTINANDTKIITNGTSCYIKNKKVVTSKAFCKGDIVVSEKPLVAFQTLSNRAEVICCGFCHTFVGPLSLQLSIASINNNNNNKKKLSSATTFRKQAILKLGECEEELESINSMDERGSRKSKKSATDTAAITCSSGCDEVYCSIECRNNAEENGHHLLCASISGNGSPIYEFNKWVKQNSETISMAARILASILHKVSKKMMKIEDVIQIFSNFYTSGVPWWEINITNKEKQSVMEDQATEAWEMLQTTFIHIHEFTEPLYNSILNFEFFCKILEIIELNALPIEIDSPLKLYFKNLYKQTTEIKEKAIEKVIRIFGLEPIEDEKTINPVEKDIINDKIITERRVARFAQEMSNPHEVYFSDFNAVGLLPTISCLNHSCVPNVQIEINDTNSCDISVCLLALRDIEEGEEVTISYIKNTDPRNKRQKALLDGVHKYECDCLRCRYEEQLSSKNRITRLKDNEDNKNIFDISDLHLLAKQATEESRFEDTILILQDILDLDPNDGEAIYAIGASYLSIGEWAKAHKIWDNGGKKLGESFPLLKIQMMKDESYFAGVTSVTTKSIMNFSDDDFEKVSISQETSPSIFLSKRRILTKDECKMVIENCEKHASKLGGWTTSRHYAVPTTDLPVHSMPEIQNFVNELLSSRLCPMLALQFSIPAEKIRIHDAFIVKYDMHAQRNLPIHIDQSTYSFTIALNSVSEYEGGGTYFCDLGRAIRVDEGKVLSFKGSLFHGGDPIVAGTRYIIAAFVYVDTDCNVNMKRKFVDNNDNDNKSKKKKNISISEKVGFGTTSSNEKAAGGFSFNFGL